MDVLDWRVTYVLVIDQLHKHKLAVRALRMCHILERPAQLLDRNVLLRDRIERRATFAYLHPKITSTILRRILLTCPTIPLYPG
jgi:hypothetical protein